MSFGKSGFVRPCLPGNVYSPLFLVAAYLNAHHHTITLVITATSYSLIIFLSHFSRHGHYTQVALTVYVYIATNTHAHTHTHTFISLR